MNDEPAHRIPAVEWRARPTMAMMACLRRVESTRGWLTPTTSTTHRGYTINRVGQIEFYWYSTQCVRGLIARGLVDGQGYMTEAGRAALKEPT
jgi:hypothetical protein